MGIDNKNQPTNKQKKRFCKTSLSWESNHMGCNPQTVTGEIIQLSSRIYEG